MDILHSITRKRILEVCKSLAIKAIEGSFRVNEIMKADGVFLAGTMMELSEVNNIENVTYPIGSEFFKRLKNAYKLSVFHNFSADFKINYSDASI